MIPAKVHLSHAVVVIAATLVGLLGTGSASVSAHARLESSMPISGSALDSLPATIDLAFTEPIVSDRASFTLIGTDESLFEIRDATVSDDARSVQLPLGSPNRGPGVYSLRWAVTSATDGHDSSGLLVFSIGTGIAPAEAFLTSSERAPWWEIAAEAVLLITLALVGVLLILRVHWGTPGSFGIAAIVGVAVLTAAGVTAWEPEAWFVASQAGRIRLLAGALALIAAFAVLLGTWRGALIGWIVWIGAVVAVSASGHAAGPGRPELAIALTSLHSAIALAWLGALIAVAIEARDGTPLAVARRLSQVATVGLAVIVVAGVATAALHIDGNRAAMSSLYGRTLLVKILLVVLVVALAATNRWVVIPWLAARQGAADGQSRLILAAEAGALAAVVCLAAVLSATAPPADTALTNVAPRASEVDLASAAGELDVQLTARLAGTAEDQYAVTVSDASGTAPIDIQRLIVATAFSADESSEPEIGERFDAQAIPGQAGRFAFTADHLGRTGLWTVEIIVRRSDLTDVSAEFELDTGSRQRTSPRLGSDEWRWPVVSAGAWLLVALALLIPAITVWAIRRQGPLAPLSGAIIMIAVAMIASGFVIQAVQRTPARTDGHELEAPGLVDPIAGQSAWATYCLTCHGATGVGVESPDPLHQHGSRADLLDRSSRQLSDGDLYWLISTGVGNTQMPAYDAALSEAERWELVAYIRQLQQGGR